MSCKERFVGKDVAEAYKKHRPGLPIEICNLILDYLQEKLPSPYYRAVDVGCGSGQCTFPLAPYFEQVLGVDISADQIEQGNNDGAKPPNVSFITGDACWLPLVDSSAQLVVAANAVHWFDPLDHFFKEVNRVLVPGGCLALILFTERNISHEDLGHNLNLFVKTFLDNIQREGWPKEKPNVYTWFQNLELPFNDVKRLDRLTDLSKMTVEAFLATLSTCSSYRKGLEQNSFKTDPLEDLRCRFYSVIGGLEPGKVVVGSTQHIHMILGRKEAFQ